jgi:triacylglycerol lipase
MKPAILLIFAFLSIPCFAQLEEGFKKEEARDMAALCNSFTYLELYNSDADIIPAGYQKKYTSCTLGMDNIYQIYQNGKVAIINFRGSTSKKISWMENIYSAMVPAEGKMEVSEKKFKYCFTKDSGAAVHAGYALEIAFLSKDLLHQIKLLNRKGVHHFIITGHSQGGALANMFRAYVENQSRWKVKKKNEFKTYAFAAPMVGNKQFAEAYNAKYAINQTSFNIVNPSDLIPKFPLSYSEPNSLKENFKTFLLATDLVSMKKIITDGLIVLFEESMNKSVNKLCCSVADEISKDIGPFVMPPYVLGYNYAKLGNRIEIDPAVFPKILKDSTILEGKIIKAVFKKSEEGSFISKLFYAKESWSYQHKPYNYYTSIMKMYFPKDYDRLERQYFIEK